MTAPAEVPAGVRQVRAEVPGAQHLQALAKANEYRLARAALKRRIATGDLAVADFLTEAPAPQFAGLTIIDLLTAQHRWGVDRTSKCLSRLQIRETRRIGDLTERQRRRLIDELTLPYRERIDRWNAESAQRWGTG